MQQNIFVLFIIFFVLVPLCLPFATCDISKSGEGVDHAASHLIKLVDLIERREKFLNEKESVQTLSTQDQWVSDQLKEVLGVGSLSLPVVKLRCGSHTNDKLCYRLTIEFLRNLAVNYTTSNQVPDPQIERETLFASCVERLQSQGPPNCSCLL